MFIFPENRRQGFFLLPDELVGKIGKNGPYSTLWARLTPSARAVLLTLGSHVDNTNIAFPSEERLAGFSNLTRKTVRRSVRELEDSQLIEIKRYLTRSGRSGKKFEWKLRRSGEESMRIHHTMLDGGIWRELTPSAKSLYLSFRFFGRARPDLDPDFDDEEDSYGAFLSANEEGEAGEDWFEYLKERKVDFCNADPQQLCDFAGVSRRHLNEALANLAKIKLVTEFNAEYWQVAIWPPEYWKAEFLNRKIIESGGVK